MLQCIRNSRITPYCCARPAAAFISLAAVMARR